MVIAISTVDIDVFDTPLMLLLVPLLLERLPLPRLLPLPLRPPLLPSSPLLKKTNKYAWPT